MGDRERRKETFVPDIPRFTGPTRALVHDALEGFPGLIVRPRRVEPELVEDLESVARAGVLSLNEKK